MAGLRYKVSGMEKVMAKLSRQPGIARRAMRAGLYGLGNVIMTASKKIVPFREGILRGSGFVTLPTKAARESKVELGYGGPAKAYAKRQHEEIDWIHPEGGEAEYLRKPVNEHGGSKGARILEAIANRSFEAQTTSKVSRGSLPTTPNQGPK